MNNTPIAWRKLSPELKQKGRLAWERLLERHSSDLFADWHEPIKIAFALSDFLVDSAIQDPLWLIHGLQEGSLWKPTPAQGIEQVIQQAVQRSDTEEALMRNLRVARRHIQSHIIWRDMLGCAELDETLAATTALADSAILCSLDWLYKQLETRWGTPVDQQGNKQPMLVLGMGKLGGEELNVSSDIDLIFCYPEEGETQGARRERDNQEFFTRLGQRLIHVLNHSTCDGRVFRVDMRLRPFGDSGPLVMPFSAIEDYYQEHGRDWERYAMIKARLLGKNDPYHQQLVDMLMPFVFRRYIDFSAIQSLRQMKMLIRQDERRRQLENNIKLGRGGIREIEFIAQAFQLIRGGRDPALQPRSLNVILPYLQEAGLLGQKQVAELQESYRFLRNLEHRLQGMRDQQTQTLPDDELSQERVALSLRLPHWKAVLKALDKHRNCVHAIFQDVVGNEAEAADEDGVDNGYLALWQATDWSAEHIGEHLAEQGIAYAAEMGEPLIHFKQQVAKRKMGPRGRECIDRLIPKLLHILTVEVCSAAAFRSILTLLDTILTRTAYLELLQENPAALKQLVRLCNASEWIAQHLSHYPILLDELLVPAQLYSPTAIDAYADELRQFLLRIPDDDLEQQMEALRQFKQIQLLRIAATDVTGGLPLMAISDHITALAEAILRQVVQLAWLQVAQKHGVPEDAQGPETLLAVIGYGKLGGYELGYGSDLDLVFLHQAQPGETNGERPIENQQFFVKLVQRITHIFTTRMPSGILYDIDLRLRPSGNSGLLVCPMKAFADYQQTEAWVWEHQALVRARIVFGNHQLHQQFNSLRRMILCQLRNLNTLAEEVASMRQKMRNHLSKGTDELFDLKQDAGGIADIEFIAQYLVLAYSNMQPDMAVWPDNVRIFETAARLGLLPLDDAEHLTQAYITLRELAHRLTLGAGHKLINRDDISGEIAHVEQIWSELFIAAE